MLERKIKYGLLLLICALSLKAQEKREASVSFISGESVYLRFESTEGVTEGDTLFQGSEQKPCLRILKVSSVSVLAESIGSCFIEKGSVFHLKLKSKPSKLENTVSDAELQIAVGPAESREDSLSIKQNEVLPEARIYKNNYLNLGLSSALTQSTNGRSNIRSVFRANLRMDSLFGKNIRFESFGNFQDFRRTYKSDADPFRANLYNMALTYRSKEHHQISLGRKINRRVASLGAIDGLQWEANYNNYRLGLIVGSRPDFENFSFNPSLMQYGLYGAYDWREKTGSGQISLGILEQRNDGQIDRRYLYTQQNFHRKRFSSFASAEIDLYENFDTATAANAFKLSSLFLSARYRINSRWNVFASYDSRQQIIFFERYDSEIERLLAEQGARQGLRLRSDYRFFKATSLGVSYNFRTNPSFGNNSENIQIYLRQGSIPWIGGSLLYRFNKNENGNLSSEINSIRYSRNFPANWRFSMNYRYVAYNYTLWDITQDPQMNYGLELSKSFNQNWNIALMGEYSQLNEEDLIRVFIRINKRLRF